MMAKADLPTENVFEPNEGARQPYTENEMPPNIETNPAKKITFANDTESHENTSSQQSSSYKEALSQPNTELSHRQRLVWLQKRRRVGLWVQCNDCDRWRYMPTVLDRYELPHKWYCYMNPDIAFASCTVPEAPIRVRDEEDLIHSEYSSGSVVWAQLAGWPWWPAMVDDCPDAEQFYWLDGFSDIPTHYNVVFFDSNEATRAWIAPEHLKPYIANKKSFNYLLKNKTLQYRLKAAMAQAEDAEKLTLSDRLAKYSFVVRYKGSINSPKHINKADTKKYQKKINNKFNIDISIESSESDEENVVQTNKASKRKNVIILGTPKSGKKPKSRIAKNLNEKFSANMIDVTNNQQNSPEQNIEEAQDSDIMKPPNSLVAQAGSTLESAVTHSIDNDSSKNYISDSVGVTETQHDFTIRIETPNSDDFDF